MATGTPNKRSRKANFSNAETRVLLEEVGLEKTTISSCFSNEVSNSKKRAIWAEIQVKVNSCGVAHRSVADLKEKWGALKRSVKDRSKDQKVTGGGRPLPTVDFEDVIVGIIGEESPIFDGLNGKLAQYFYESTGGGTSQLWNSASTQ